MSSLERLKKWVQSNPELKKAADERWVAANRDKRRATWRAYAERNKERRRSRSAQYYAKNKEKLAAKRARYRADNPHIVTACGARRRARELRATPAWANHSVIAQFYARAADISRVAGVLHQVDHIVPLAGKNVCGLHVEHNLQILDVFANRKKRNSHT